MENNPQKNISKNFLKLFSTESIGRVIGIVTTPLISRLYSPEDFGILSVFISFISIIGPFICFSYPNAIPFVRNRRLCGGLIGGSIIFLFASISIVSIVLLLFREIIFSLFSITKLADVWFSIPAGLLFYGFNEIFSQYCVRKRAFGLMSKVSLYQKSSGVIVKILCGFLCIKPLGLLFGDLMNSFGGFSLYFRTFGKDFVDVVKTTSLKKIRYSLNRYSNYPIYRLPSKVLLQVSGNIPNFFFAWYFSTTSLGYISMARTLLSLPVVLIGFALGKSFVGEIANAGKDNGKLIYNLSMNIVRKLFLFGIIVSICVFVFAPIVFKYVLGSQWEQSGLYARLFIIPFVLQIIYSPLSEGIFNIFNKQSYILYIEIFRMFIITSVLYYIFNMQLPIIQALLLYNIALFIQYSIALYLIYKLLCEYRSIK